MENVSVGSVSIIIPTWLCARHTLGAIKSIRQYYPDIPIFIVDDEYNETDVDTWNQLYNNQLYRPDVIFDTDYSKLVGLKNCAYIQGPHFGYETEGHGRAVTYGMEFIHTRWVVHISSDVRLVKDGLLEYMFKDVDTSYGVIGERANAPEGYINMGKWICAFRADLYHEYKLDFLPDTSIPVDAGTPAFTKLKDLGWGVKTMNFRDHYVHMRYNGDDEWWERHY